MSAVVPDWSDPLDDFNRANGPVYAGAGAAIWENHQAGSTSLTPCLVSGNQLKGGGGWQFCVSLADLHSDCDFVVDMVSPGSGIGFLLGGVDTDLSTWTGVTVGFSGGTWYFTQKIDGTGYAIGSPSAPTPVPGETYWLSKRGTQISLYVKPAGGGPYSIIGSPAIADQIPGEGRFGVQFADSSGLVDNLRGGPIKAAVIIVPTRVVRIKTSAGWMDIN